MAKPYLDFEESLKQMAQRTVLEMTGTPEMGELLKDEVSYRAKAIITESLGRGEGSMLDTLLSTALQPIMENAVKEMIEDNKEYFLTLIISSVEQHLVASLGKVTYERLAPTIRDNVEAALFAVGNLNGLDIPSGLMTER